MPSQPANRLLASLSPESQDWLISRSVNLVLPVKTRLFDAEQTPSHAYFMTSGMASVVTTMEDGDTAEVGIIVSKVWWAASTSWGQPKVSTNSFIQLEGSGYKIPLSELQKGFRTSEEIRDRILEFYQEQSLTVSQIAGCNRLHEAEERLARWLLMAQDRVQSDLLNFTQEFLGMMLGSRRTTVTLIAGALQRAELIEYSRGKVKILDRERLETAACDCYRIARDLFTNLYAKPAPGSGANGFAKKVSSSIRTIPAE